MPFVKLDCGMLDSTLWPDRDGREMFITGLLMAVPHEVKVPQPTIQIRSLEPGDYTIPPGWYGFVPAASTGIARRAGIPAEQGLAALERLASPESESRTPDHEGRRMVRVDGGFVILNYDTYRKKDHTAATRSKRYREKQAKEAASRVTETPSRVAGRSVTQAEAEAEAYLKKEVGQNGDSGAAVAAPIVGGDVTGERCPECGAHGFTGTCSNHACGPERHIRQPKAKLDMDKLSKMECYSHVDLKAEFQKMEAWCSLKGKQSTMSRFVNWINKIEKPMSGRSKPKSAGPSMSEVAAYCKEKWGDQPDHPRWAVGFFNHWLSKGWLQNGILIDWKIKLTEQVAKWRGK